ncbi:MAG: hypothetical protein HYW52_09210 [Gemmatimonadetes bacterium]|nr:hypothetical protein [Gemmatimonadota bacterium]
MDRSRNLNRLNPEISVTGDVRLNATSEEPASDNVDVREFEFSFQSALDPYSSTKIFASYEEGAFTVEEAYAYWTGLPASLRIDVGRFRQQVGELNRWHQHALPQSEYPIVLHRFFGEDGLIGDGVALYWMAPVGGGALGAHELWGQATLANNEALFGGGNRVALLGHLNNFWQLSRSTFFQVGGTAIYGENPDSSLKTRVFGVDARISWRPPERALYPNFTLRGEGYRLTQDVAGTSTTHHGAYLSAEYQLSRRLFAGARYDYVESLTVGGEHEWAIVPTPVPRWLLACSNAPTASSFKPCGPSVRTNTSSSNEPIASRCRTRGRPGGAARAARPRRSGSRPGGHVAHDLRRHRARDRGRQGRCRGNRAG